MDKKSAFADIVLAVVAGPLVTLTTSSAAATATPVGSENPTGRWATPAAIQAIILSQRLDVDECPGGPCRIGRPATKPGVVQEGPTKVLSATVVGVAPFKLVNGVRRFQLFEVRACTIFYFRGARRLRVHFRWFTRRPPGGMTTNLHRDGTVSVDEDSGEPYARDWNHPLFPPLAYGRC